MEQEQVEQTEEKAKRQRTRPPTGRWFIYTIHQFGTDWRSFVDNFYRDRKFDYCVGQLERGEETEKEHVQLVGYWKNSRIVGAVQNNVKHIGHVERCWDIKASIAYVQKDETRVDGPIEFGEKPLDPPACMADFKQRVMDGEDWRSLLLHPVHRLRFTNWARDVYRHFHRRKPIAIRPMSEFNRPPLDFSDGKPWLVIGNTGLGKSSWIFAHFKSPLVVEQMEHFLNWNPELYDAIVVDDMKIDWTREQWICATGEHYRSVRCRYVNADDLPLDVPFVITSNYMPVMVDTEPAVRRRLNILHITEPLFRTEEEGEDFDLTRH